MNQNLQNVAFPAIGTTKKVNKKIVHKMNIKQLSARQRKFDEPRSLDGRENWDWESN